MTWPGPMHMLSVSGVLWGMIVSLLGSHGFGIGLIGGRTVFDTIRYSRDLVTVLFAIRKCPWLAFISKQLSTMYALETSRKLTGF